MGKLISLNVLELKPTQMAIGYYEVDQRIELLKNMKKSNLDEYLRDRAVPIIVGPRNEYYMIDRHHLVRSAWEAGVVNVYGEIKADLSDLNIYEFWDRMKKEKWVLLQDQFGTKHQDPKLLPSSIRKMADDPYRSLSWMLRENKIYTKVKIPFSEFQWANELRNMVSFENTESGLKSAYADVVIMTKNNPERFMHLPGFKVI